jgi:hypothetical protein
MNSQICVRCVIDSDCGNPKEQRCDVSKHTCEAIPPPPPPTPGTKQACESCTNETECAGYENSRAVCTQHGNFGKYCFVLAQGSCEQPRSAQAVTGKQGMYCMPPSSVSCEALNKIGASCTQPQGQCGAGGECLSDHCTYRCDGDNQCPKSHDQCSAIPLTQGPKYCGQN